MNAPGQKATGMHCPGCGRKLRKVIDSRPVPGGIRRRRVCLNCDQRVTTFECIETVGRPRERRRRKGDGL